jgi:hypothetical protein
MNEPLSDPSAVDPAEAFVSSLSSCHMLWFLSIAAARKFRVDTYSDHAISIPRLDSQRLIGSRLRPRAVAAVHDRTGVAVKIRRRPAPPLAATDSHRLPARDRGRQGTRRAPFDLLPRRPSPESRAVGFASRSAKGERPAMVTMMIVKFGNKRSPADAVAAGGLRRQPSTRGGFFGALESSVRALKYPQEHMA